MAPFRSLCYPCLGRKLHAYTFGDALCTSVLADLVAVALVEVDPVSGTLSGLGDIAGTVVALRRA